MSAFPGFVFDGEGRPIGGDAPELVQDLLDTFAHGSMVVAIEDLAPVARLWLVNDNATFSAVPPEVVDEAVALMLAGRSILILARKAEPDASVREGLLDALDLAQAPVALAGRA